VQQKIYIDNSVLGDYFDQEFLSPTRMFFARIQQKECLVHISEISELELLDAPQYVKNLKDDIPHECFLALALVEEAEELAETYINENILGQASANDSYHIAIATVNRIDVLISWNFKHIVNLDKIRLFNSVNLKMGFPEIDIRTPREMISYEES